MQNEIGDEIGGSDRVTAGLYLAVIIWCFDHGLTLLGSWLRLYPKPVEGIGLLFITLTALVAPFWIARGLFQAPRWRSVPHGISDRIWVVLFAAGAQLGFDAIALQWVSPGKLVMSFLYVVICSFGAVSGYRALGSIDAFGSGRQQVPTADELKRIRFRVQFAGVVACFSLLAAQAALQNTSIFSGSSIVYLFLLCLGIFIPALMFQATHNRCPRCGQSLKASISGCPSCSAN